MKSLLIAAALTSVALASSASAYSPENAQPAGAATAQPTPAKVVAPTGLPPSAAGSLVRIEFSLDQAGQPHEIKVHAVRDEVLKRQLVAAFRQWRFEPAANQPKSGAQRFILPLQLLPEV